MNSVFLVPPLSFHPSNTCVPVPYVKFSWQHTVAICFPNRALKASQASRGKDLTQNSPDVLDKKPFPRTSLLLTSQGKEHGGLCYGRGPDCWSLSVLGYVYQRPHAAACLPLFARVEGKLIHSYIELRADVIQAPIVTEGSPLHVDTHPPLFPLHQLHVPHLLHVAGVAARACQPQRQRGLTQRCLPPTQGRVYPCGKDSLGPYQQ